MDVWSELIFTEWFPAGIFARVSVSTLTESMGEPSTRTFVPECLAIGNRTHCSWSRLTSKDHPSSPAM